VLLLVKLGVVEPPVGFGAMQGGVIGDAGEWGVAIPVSRFGVGTGIQQCFESLLDSYFAAPPNKAGCSHACLAH